MRQGRHETEHSFLSNEEASHASLFSIHLLKSRAFSSKQDSVKINEPTKFSATSPIGLTANLAAGPIGLTVDSTTSS